jgi:hypothetical protein
VKITYFNKREIEKRVRGVILGQKLTLNHPSLVDDGEETRVFVTAHSLVDDGEETRVFVTAHKRERKKRERSAKLNY